jgi:hypothetical protein
LLFKIGFLRYFVITILACGLLYIQDLKLAKSQPGNLFGGLKERLERALGGGPFGAGPSTPPPSNITFGDEQVLANSSSFTTPPLSSASGSNVYVVWTQYSSNGSGSIMLRASNNNGTSFSQPILVSDRIGLTATPILTTSGNNVYIAWTEYFSNGSGSIMLRASNDNGITFSRPSVITGNLPYQAFPPVLAASGNNVYLAWLDESFQKSQIKLKSSRNGGANFSDSNLIISQNILGPPAISASDNNVYLLWSDIVPGNGKIYFKTSNNDGATFGNAVTLAAKSRFTNSPILETSGNNVYVLWQDGRPDNLKLFLLTSNNNGASFSHPSDLSDRTMPGISLLSASGNNVYVGWIDASFGGNNTLLVRNSNDDGKGFGNAKSLANGIGKTNIPILDSSKNNVFFTWINNTGVSIKSSENGGKSFDNATFLKPGSESQSHLILPISSSVSTAGNNKMYISSQEVSISRNGVANIISFRVGTISSH